MPEEKLRVMTPLEFETVNYIRANFYREDTLALVMIDRRNGHKVGQRITTAEELASEKYQRFLRAANANGNDIFISMSALKPGSTGRTKEDVAEVRHIFLDLDHGGKEAIGKLMNDSGMPRPHHVLESSPGKFQAIWSVKDFDKPQAEALMRTMVPIYEADPAATDVSRVLRLPGFRNWKYETPHYAREVELTSPATKQDYAPSDFPGFDPAQMEELRTAQRANRTAAGVNAGGADSSQSAKDFSWVIRQLKQGRDSQSVKAELEGRRPDKPNPRYYADITVEMALRKAGAEIQAAIASRGQKAAI